MAEVLYYKIEVDTGDSTRKLLGEMTAQLKSINDEYKQLISAKDKDTASIGRNREQYAALTKDINTLSKSIVSSQAASEKDAAEKIKLANEIKNTNNKLEEAFVKSEMAKAAALEKEIIAIKNYNNKLEEAYQKSEQKAREKAEANTFQSGSIAALRQELSKATLAYDRLGKAERDSAAGKQMEQSIAAQVAELNKLEQATGRYARQVGNYNTAGVAMSQVLREIPAFTYSAQTGILALSNNIPILVDEMRNMAEAIDGVTGKKKGWGSAIKEMAKNLFSLGGVMTIALGLFTIFSDKIIDAITGTKTLTAEQKKLKEDQADVALKIYETANAWKVYKGVISETEAELSNSANETKQALEKIDKETKEKLDSITSWYNVMWTNLQSGSLKFFDFMIGMGGKYLRKKVMGEEEYLSGRELRQKAADEVLKKHDAEVKLHFEQMQQKYDSKAIENLMQTTKKIEDLRNDAIVDEDLRERKKIETRYYRDLNEINKSLALEDYKQAQRTERETQYQLELDALDTKLSNKRAEKQKKAAEDLAKKLAEIDAKKLELKRQYNNELIDLIPDQFKRERDKETYRHYNLLEDYKAAQKKYPELKAEYNNLIESEEKTHAKNMEDILIDAVLRQSKISEDEKKIQLKQKEEYDKAVRQMVIDQIEDDEKVEEKRNKDLIETKKILYQYLFQAEQQFFRMKEEAIARSLKREEAMIEASAETQQNILKNRLDKGIISEAQYNADKNELDRQTQEKKLAAQKESFLKEKKLALAQIAVNTALGISNVWATPGTPLPIKIAQTAGIVAINALQAAAVNAQEFATGGLVKDKDRNIVPKANGDSVLATLTPGEVVLNERQQQMLGGASTFAKIGVPGFTPMPNSASGGSVSSISKKEFQAMFSGLGKMINSKKVYQLESENKRVRESVQSYESNSKW